MAAQPRPVLAEVAVVASNKAQTAVAVEVFGVRAPPVPVVGTVDPAALVGPDPLVTADRPLGSCFMVPALPFDPPISTSTLLAALELQSLLVVAHTGCAGPTVGLLAIITMALPSML